MTFNAVIVTSPARSAVFLARFNIRRNERTQSYNQTTAWRIKTRSEGVPGVNEIASEEIVWPSS